MPSLAILLSAVLVLSRGQTDRQTDRQTESHSDTDDHLTHATTVGVSKYPVYSHYYVLALYQYSSKHVANAKARFPLPELTVRVNGPS